MVFLKKILVTTDLSEHSLSALEYARSLGLLYCSKLYLLYVVEGSTKLPLHAAMKQREKEAETQARKGLGEFVQKNISSDVEVTPVVVSGTPHEAISRFAEDEGVDMIVMATHDRTGFHDMIMGSVAEKVVRSSSIPVLTVKPRSKRETLIREEDIEHELHLA